jgi:hypothetical protein
VESITSSLYGAIPEFPGYLSDDPRRFEPSIPSTVQSH